MRLPGYRRLWWVCGLCGAYWHRHELIDGTAVRPQTMTEEVVELHDAASQLGRTMLDAPLPPPLRRWTLRYFLDGVLRRLTRILERRVVDTDDLPDR